MFQLTSYKKNFCLETPWDTVMAVKGSWPKASCQKKSFSQYCEDAWDKDD